MDCMQSHLFILSSMLPSFSITRPLAPTGLQQLGMHGTMLNHAQLQDCMLHTQPQCLPPAFQPSVASYAVASACRRS